MTEHRPVYAEIDLDALAANTAMFRSVIGPDTRFYGVCKGDAYGVGLGQAAPVMLGSGADALAVADAADVVKLRNAGIAAPILLYPSSTPDRVAEIAELGATVSIFDWTSLEAFVATGSRVSAHAKIDCGFGRFGLEQSDWEAAFAQIRATPHLHLAGIYAHFAHTDRPDAIDAQKKNFQRAIDAAEAAGLRDLEYMAASSRIVLGRTDLIFNAVNPGRGLYGWLEDSWRETFPAQPVVRKLLTRVLQVKSLAAGSWPGYADGPLAAPIRIAVLATGFADGLPRVANGLPVLIRGQRAPTLGMRSTEHAVVDVTEIEGVSPGDEAVIVGAQSGEVISFDEVAATSGIPLIELLPRIARGAIRRYSNGAAGSGIASL